MSAEGPEPDDPDDHTSAYYNPWETLFPGCEFDDSILAFRPRLTLWHRIPDKAAYFKLQQQRDPKLKALIQRLQTVKCPVSCTGCCHSHSCIRAHWCLSPGGLLLRKGVSDPLEKRPFSLSIAEKLQNKPCQCPPDSPSITCPHYSYTIGIPNKWAVNSKRDKLVNKNLELSAGVGEGSPALADKTTRAKLKKNDARRTKAKPKKTFTPAWKIIPESAFKSLCRRLYRLVVPASLVDSVLYWIHGSGVAGHPGRNRTMSRAHRTFYWKGMRRDVTKWVTSCLPCQQRKPYRPRHGLSGPVPLPTERMSLLYIDFCGPFPETVSKNVYILTIVDAFSRYPFAIPLPSRKASLVVRALINNVVQHYSCPSVIISDGAKEFIGTVMSDFCKIFNIKKVTNARYSPWLASYVERYHGWQNSLLAIVTSKYKDNWDLVLPLISLCYRTTVHDSIGVSPFEALRGFKPRLPWHFWEPWPTEDPIVLSNPDLTVLRDVFRDVAETVRTNHEKSSLRRRRRKLPRARRNPISFSPGDIVLAWAPKSAEKLPKNVTNKPKLNDCWSLPQLVVARGEGNMLIIRDLDGKTDLVSPDLLRHYEYFTDGLPSVPPRKGFSPGERRLLNKDVFVPQHPRVGDLVCFPLTLGDGTAGFGVGRVIACNVTPQGTTYDCHWMSNDDESLSGPFMPCWTTSDGWYADEKQRHAADGMVTTGKYYPSPISIEVLADTKFKLLDGFLPDLTIRRIHEHPAFDWVHPNPQCLPKPAGVMRG